MLELVEVGKSYAGAREPIRAVDGVSLDLAAGEMVALQGPSGSGKTTLLMLIATLIAPEQGEISFRGRSLAGFTEAEASRYLRRDVGFVYQGFQLMPRVSALENAALKPLLDGVGPRRARELAKPWLRRLGLGERMHRTPEQLSSGERQRLAIARALVCDPPLVLADEPTANLDSVRSLDTFEVLRDAAHEQGAAVVLVSHDAEAATIADRSLLLRDGSLTQLADAAVP